MELKQVEGGSRQLCKLEDLPRHLQFNRDILTGYRRPMSVKECLKSWRYLHNESFNCYSHVFALLFFLVATRDYLSVWPSPNSPTSWLVFAFIVCDCVCSLLPFTLSILYHTFMPHHSGERTYVQLLKMDVLGVWLCCTVGPTSIFFTGLYCAEGLMVIYFTLHTSFSVYVLYYLMMEDCKKKRTVALTIQFFVRIMIYPLRLSSFSVSSAAAVKYYFVMDMISATGAVINALHIPERWFPGKLDYVLNGHTLMHIAAFMSVLIARQGFLCDMAWLNSAGVCPVNGTTAGVIETGSLTGFLLGVDSPL